MRHALILALALASASVWAQTYRWVDPATGRSVISDTPPPANAKGLVKMKEAEPAGGGQSFAVKRAAENFPVILYTSASCSNPCQQARDLLNGRGVPFEERILQNPEDGEELKKLVGDLFVPALKVGKQAVKGMEPKAYNDLLDLAGYPSKAFPGSKPSGGQAAK
jgi:glutaredoxin